MFTKLYCCYTDLVYKYNSTCRDLIKKGICCYGDVINKAKNFKHHTSKLVKSLKMCISNGCDLVIIVHCLTQVYLAKI